MNFVFRYDFTPLSVDEDKMGKLEVQDNNAVSVSLPHNNGIDATNYKGQAKPSGTKDCVLIIDHETGELTLERLSNQVIIIMRPSMYEMIRELLLFILLDIVEENKSREARKAAS